MRRRRRGLSQSERRRAGERLARRLAASPLVWRSHRIAGYLADDGELDLDTSFQRIRLMGKALYLPALRGQRLAFLPYRPGTALAPNRFGIPEPDVAAGSACPPQALDLVLMPLVAADAHGNRLGRGGGFYDRTFGYLRHRRHWRVPRLLGVAFSFQRVPELPARGWDVPLHGLVTETGFEHFERHAAGTRRRARR